MLRLYPQAWRARYGPELEAILEDATPAFATILDVALGALRVRLTAPRNWSAVLAPRASWRAQSSRLPGPPQDMRGQAATPQARACGVSRQAHDHSGSDSDALVGRDYADGVVAQFLIAQRRNASDASSLFGMPHFRVALSDELGTDYASRSYGGSGGSAGPLAPFAQWRMAFAFAPAAPVAARLLTFRVDGVGWLGDRDASGQLSETERTAGPWQYAVRLE
jgi:hypothetical protein